ncbi:MAG: DUF302 domain-containing protein [Gammaproteobacteria bacterium]|jgi:uncharacterized protein (DUF302 family)|nr:DUF302 domain-containing protein [Gammaproteobacteria bacterium]MDH3821813.1 DUF302 domain-containing protein [Gammaproteobacteria bacterium]MDH3984036.1 DUF302 domain-containing protein [Gammaproteobacteria bacterium]HKJ20464.1 DUF302 domain-containing protein [Woeseiaceae bacterium]
MNSDFGFGKVVDASFDDAIDKVTAELEKEGFGVLSDIDVAAKMKAKLDKDMPRYRILGACNPALAYQAISAVEDIGLLLPCNVLVREDSNDKVHVDFMDPERVLSLVKDPAVAPLAADVKSRLQRVLETL